MSPIPNPRDLAELRGLKYQVTESSPAGRPLRLSFSTVKEGPLDRHLVKGPRASALDPEAQAATAWFLRYRNGAKWTWLKCGEAGAGAGALAKAAFTLVQLARSTPTNFGRYVAQIQERAGGLTVGALADEWIAAGLPKKSGLLRERPDTLTNFLKHALAFWRGVPVALINRAKWDEYVDRRRSQVAQREIRHKAPGRPRRTGNRAIDHERQVLCSLFAWGLALDKVTANPFAKFPKSRDPRQIVNCNVHAPGTDEEFHQICAHLIGNGRPTAALVAGAQLLFQGLTGLRPGEPGALRWNARAGSLVHAAGFLHTITRGKETHQRLAVARHKRGITPYVKIHPALAEFITAWKSYCSAHWPDSPWWFPCPSAPDHPLCPFDEKNTPLSMLMARTVKTLGLPYRRPHGMRAFYVRCRRSQDASDADIADELGERTGAVLITNIYGDPSGVRGDGLFDWLPSPESGLSPAWAKLSAACQAVIPFHAQA